MFDLFFIIAVVFAIINWLAVWYGWKKIEYIAKPATMLALIAWLVTTAGVSGALLFFTFGLVFSMFGDVFLMLPGDKFIPGLVAFLTGHVCYIVGFNFKAPPVNLITLVILGTVCLIAIAIIRPLRAALQAKGQKALLVPVQIYAGVISLMLLSALVTLARPEWEPTAAILASLGAASFFLSDSLLAWNKFVTPVFKAHLFVMVTYHLGQFLIAISAVLQFTK